MTVDVVVADLVAVDASTLDADVGSRVTTPSIEDTRFVDAMVARVCADSGAAAGDVRRRADELLAEFRDARVRAFISVLLEKQLRRSFRRPARSW